MLPTSPDFVRRETVLPHIYVQQEMGRSACPTLHHGERDGNVKRRHENEGDGE